jgi:hypothetical protein
LEHFSLSYGDAFAGVTIEVARLARDGRGGYVAEFLVDAGESDSSGEAVADVRRDLDFYLDELNHGPGGAWAYAKYHGGTMADVYSGVHWTYHPGETDPDV